MRQNARKMRLLRSVFRVRCNVLDFFLFFSCVIFLLWCAPMPPPPRSVQLASLHIYMYIYIYKVGLLAGV